jgi:signal transduction histidine kinase/ligand-binding sensor domain-containing protein/CheY-like chemotaxis protein/AraC-like DNA-binding protein
MKRTTTFFFLIIIFITISNKCLAQVEKFYSTEKDISNSLINKIYQDKKGFIWIATEDGLNKYDGTKFTIYKNISKDNTSLKNNYVKTMYEDTQGRFWIACINGLLLYNRAKDSFKEIEAFRGSQTIHPQVTSIIESKYGDIWMTTSGEGLVSIKRGSDKCTAETNISKNLCSSFLTYVFEDSKHQLWVASENKGLNVYNPFTKKTRWFGAPGAITNNNVSCLCEDKKGNIFIGTLSGGLNLYNPKTGRISAIPYKSLSTKLRIKSLLINSRGELLIGTDGQGLKIYNYSKNVIEDYEISTTLFDFSQAKVHSILEDKAGNLWTGLFQKGVYFIPSNSNKFNYFGYRSLKQNNIGSSCVMSIFKDKNSTIWVGTDNDGLYGISDNGKKATHYTQTNNIASVSNTIMSIFEDSNKTLWLGSYINGLEQFNRATNTCLYTKDLFPNEKDVPNDRVSCISEDRNKNLWIGTYGYGIYSLNLKTNKLTHHPSKVDDKDLRINRVPSNWVNCVIADSEGLIWIGTYKGVCCYNPVKKTYVTYSSDKNLLPGDVVFTLLEDSFHKIWIGTTEGLACFDKKTKAFTHYTINDGLPSNVICSMFEDEKKNLWLSTHYGISKFVPSQKKFINYYSFDGLQSNEFYRGAGFQSADGQIFFGGIKGITHFYPKEIVDRITRLTVFITDLYIFEKPVREGDKSGSNDIISKAVIDEDKFILSYKDNAFSFELSVLDYSNPERIVYEYQMEGLNKDWISTRPGMNRASFTNLSPGTYKFRFRARNNDNISETKEVTIVITPPWYQSWWAKIIYALLICQLIYGIIVYIKSRFRHRQEIMKREHAEQINEAKLQFFINISHEIRTPMTLIINPLEKLMTENKDTEVQKTYLMIYRNAQRILRLINQLMDIRKLDKGQMHLKFRETDIVGFIDDLMTTFEYQAQRKNIQFSFDHKDEALKAWIDLNNFDKILLNILSNAFKYTPENGEIKVELSTGKDESARGPLRKYFEIVISDNGIGINRDQIEKIFERFYQINNDLTNSNFGTGIGLHLSRSLVELHHGTIKAENREEGPGSRFIVRLPLGCDHLKADEFENPEDSESAVPASIHHSVINAVDQFEIESETKNKKIRPRTRFKVLVVEDEFEIRQYIKEELSGEYKISECSNGKEALEIALKEMPDLIISDVMMPEMDGITLCKKIKQNINISHIPIILLTAKSKNEDKIEGLEIGADAYIVKPFNTDLLKSTVQNLIENRERLKNKFTGNEQQQTKIQKIDIKSSDEILMEKVMKVINDNLTDPNLNVEMLAGHVGMSRVHMHRKLKELTNQSARDFIKGIRLKQAASLLSSKKLSVSEVAYATGFTNLSHFSNSFREFYGVSPKEYATDHASDEEKEEK